MPRLSASPNAVRVVVVRHGPAEVRDPARWSDDDARPLTLKGVIQTRRAARRLASLIAPVDHLATGPAVRAVSTAEILRKALDDPPKVEVWPELGSGNLAAPIFDRVRATVRSRETIVLVGHDPTLTELVGLAIVGEGISVVRLSKGGAACLEFPTSLGPAAGHLSWLLTRKQLAGAGD